MAKKSSDILRSVQEELEIQKQILEINRSINNEFTGYLNAKRNLKNAEEEIFEIEKAMSLLVTNGMSQNDKIYKEFKRQLDLKNRLLQAQRQEIKNASILVMSYKEFTKLSMATFAGFLPNIINFLAEADKSFKNVNQTLGLTGDRAKLMTSNLMEASSYAMSMGVSFEDLGKIQTSYTDEMGNSVLLSKENLKNIIAIGKGTKMGTDIAGKMVGKFDLIGKSVTQVKDFYEDAVKSSVKFGVSATKVIDALNDNFDRSQQYVFKGGIEGLKKMSMFATKFKVDMTSVFNAMDKANSLEGAVDMAAQLQVIGGKFAQTDPFSLLYQARNDAEGFTKTMQSLTKGMANFNKTTGEFEIQAGDLNRLRLAADATGMSFEDLIKQAKQGAKVNAIGGLLGGKLGKEEKEFIEGVAQIQKDGNFKVQISPNEFRDIRQLSLGQVKALMESNKSLEERAKDAQAFDEVLKNTINEMKTLFLPLLKSINGIVQSEFGKGAFKLGLGLMAASALIGTLSPIFGVLKTLAPGLLSGKLFGTTKGRSSGPARDAAGRFTGKSTTFATEAAENGKAAGGAWKNILAYGAAVVMVGGGIWLATKGISAMAEAFKGLNSDQLIGINVSLAILGVTLGGLALVMATLGPIAAGPLVAFGAGIGLIGAGVGIAAAGIGFMAQGFGDMFDSLSKVTDPKLIMGMNSLMLSMAGLGTTSLLFANPLAWIGLNKLSGSIGDISEKIRGANFDSLTVAATQFNNIASAIEKINDKKLDKLIAVSESLSGIGTLVTALNSLNSIFGDAIEVKFKDEKINLQVDVTANLDGQKVSSMLSKQVPLHIERARKGSAS